MSHDGGSEDGVLARAGGVEEKDLENVAAVDDHHANEAVVVPALLIEALRSAATTLISFTMPMKGFRRRLLFRLRRRRYHLFVQVRPLHHHLHLLRCLLRHLLRLRHRPCHSIDIFGFTFDAGCTATCTSAVAPPSLTAAFPIPTPPPPLPPSGQPPPPPSPHVVPPPDGPGHRIKLPEGLGSLFESSFAASSGAFTAGILFIVGAFILQTNWKVIYILVDGWSNCASKSSSATLITRDSSISLDLSCSLPCLQYIPPEDPYL